MFVNINTVISLATRVSAILVAGIVFMNVSILADKAPKRLPKTPVTSPSKEIPREVLQYTSPLYGAIEAAKKAVSNQGQANSTTKNLPPNGRKLTLRDSDSSKPESKIVFVRFTGDQFSVRVDLAEDQPMVEIAIFNMLGKRVADVYRGPMRSGESDHVIQTGNLPEGLYVCVFQSNVFRRAEKFYLSR